MLEIKNLSISFKTHVGEVQAVRNININVEKGDVLGIVGESGSGKSVTSLSVLRLLSANAAVKSGEIAFHNKNLLTLKNSEMQQVRGNRISMIFQDPMTSLNPIMPIGEQVAEVILEHQKIEEKSGRMRPLTKKEALGKVVELFEKVRIPDAQNRLKSYPYQFSGGMRQRVMIAMALSCNPDVLIADEPTTALDVTIQAQILDLFKEIQQKNDMSIVFITHDLGVVAEICTKVVVMYGGIIMEKGRINDIFYNPSHPYTLGLMGAIPGLEQDSSEPLRPVEGSPPDMAVLPRGCPFYTRCEHAMNICIDELPGFFNVEREHSSRCHLLDPAAPSGINPFKEGGDYVE